MRTSHPLAIIGVVAACAVSACSSVDVVGESPATPSTTTGSGASSSTTSSEGAGGTDAGVPPESTRFVLRFVSDVPESIWVDETDSAWPSGHWLTILRDGAAIRKERACEYCACDACPNCPICGAPCPTATEIPSGGEVEWSWRGFEYPMQSCPSSAEESCLAEQVSAPGSYVATFCWGTSYSGTPPCPAEVVDVQCADVPFVHPDPDGEVAYLVNNSG